MNLQCNEPSSALFSLPDISIPGYAGEKCLDNHDSSWEESLMTDSNIQPISHCRRPDILHINPAFPKSMLMMGSSLSLEGSTISEMPPSFPHQFGGQSRPFPLVRSISKVHVAYSI
uniref:Uncharacterized protein n=1 Tax=Spongospora subterranea TaxID=70186 RepID=A0A0H5RTH4_9EUKA|eukprot:CRZ12044.1 hypothetical protein [Spongospora subterranea]